jgi:hypothetical protein
MGGLAMPPAKRLGKAAGDENQAPENPLNYSAEDFSQAKINRAVYESKIKEFKAEQEELKTNAMIGKYIDASLMRYYFSFFQRGITDCFSSVKKVSPDMKRLYAAGKDREAEKVLTTELNVCFSNAIRALEVEIKKDSEEKNNG